jgi:RHS repeat-associated protein
MPTVTYTVLDGEIVSENRDGVERDYLPDPLGSTVALLDNTQAKTDTFEYWPYGEERSRTGTTPTAIRYVGARGYHRDSTSKNYVRARHLDAAKGRWITPDPISFRRADPNLYPYAKLNPTTISDPTGFDVRIPILPPPPLPPIPVWIPLPRTVPLPRRVPFVPLPPLPVPPIIVWIPLAEGYGNFCGAFHTSRPSMFPIDCIDKACREHDLCLGPVSWKWCIPFRRRLCDDQLCRAAMACLLGGCFNDPPPPPNSIADCMAVAAQLIGIFCGLRWLPADPPRGWPLPWPL